METKQIVIIILGCLAIIFSMYSYTMNQSVADYYQDLRKQDGIELPTFIERYYSQSPLVEFLTQLSLGLSIITIGFVIGKNK